MKPIPFPRLQNLSYSPRCDFKALTTQLFLAPCPPVCQPGLGDFLPWGCVDTPSETLYNNVKWHRAKALTHLYITSLDSVTPGIW